jgi:hypothetical protein
MLMIRVFCRKCKTERNTTSLKSAPCFVCGYDSVIFSKKENKSRIVKIVNGTNEMLIKRLYKEGIYGNKIQKVKNNIE